MDHLFKGGSRGGAVVPMPDHPPAPARVAEVMQAVRASADLPSLMLAVVDLAKLRATVGRDLQQIKSDAAERSQASSERHEERMTQLHREYQTRDQMIAFVREHAKMLLEVGQYEESRVVVTQLMQMVSKPV